MAFIRRIFPNAVKLRGPRMTELIVVEKIAEWQRLKALVLDSVSSPITLRVYNMALDEFIDWYEARRPGFTTLGGAKLSHPELRLSF
jgi:hypothetical protein